MSYSTTSRQSAVAMGVMNFVGGGAFGAVMNFVPAYGLPIVVVGCFFWGLIAFRAYSLYLIVGGFFSVRAFLFIQSPHYGHFALGSNIYAQLAWASILLQAILAIVPPLVAGRGVRMLATILSRKISASENREV